MSQLLFGLSVTGVGMVVVFSGLVILIVCIGVMNIFNKRGNNRQASAPKAAPAPVPAPTPAPAAPQAPAQAGDDALIAVITAAVAAVWQGQSGFTVRRVRRVSNSPAWQRAGREEQMYSRF